MAIAASASFCAVHRETRTAARDALSGLRSRMFGPTADELLQQAVLRFNLAEYVDAATLCRKGLRRFPDHRPFRELLGRIHSPELLSSLISVSNTGRRKFPEGRLDQIFRELLDLESQSAGRR